MEIGWSELLVIAVVALIVIGPKDLPEMFRTFGRFTAKLRSMAREFSRAMEDAAKESGVSDVANDLRKVANPKSMGLDAVKSAADRFEKWDPLKGTKAALNDAVTPTATVPTPKVENATTSSLTSVAEAKKADAPEPVVTSEPNQTSAASAPLAQTPINQTPVNQTMVRGGRLRGADSATSIGVNDIESLMATPSHHKVAAAVAGAAVGAAGAAAIESVVASALDIGAASVTQTIEPTANVAHEPEDEA